MVKLDRAGRVGCANQGPGNGLAAGELTQTLACSDNSRRGREDGQDVPEEIVLNDMFTIYQMFFDVDILWLSKQQPFDVSTGQCGGMADV